MLGEEEEPGRRRLAFQPIGHRDRRCRAGRSGRGQVGKESNVVQPRVSSEDETERDPKRAGRDRRKSILFGGWSSNIFDTLNRLTQTCQAATSPACSASAKLGSFTYALDGAGNRTAVAELNGRNVSYGYDHDYRLLSETITSDPTGNDGAETYTYDNVGNRLTLNSTIPSLSGANSYSYDSNDRLSIDTYDANRNTTSSGGVSNAYDFENRMLTHGSVSMAYDGDGNRVSETVGGTTTNYLVDDVNPTGYSQVMDEIVNGSVTRTYAYGRQLIRAD